MRYTMGRYIGELDAEGRDRLIAAPEFSDGVWWDGSCGCLVGTADLGVRDVAERYADTCVTTFEWPDVEVRRRALRLCGGSIWHKPWPESGPAMRYPKAVMRFGKDRVVRAIKIRAARLNGSSAADVARLTDGVGVDCAVGVGGGRVSKVRGVFVALAALAAAGCKPGSAVQGGASLSYVRAGTYANAYEIVTAGGVRCVVSDSYYGNGISCDWEHAPAVQP